MASSRCFATLAIKLRPQNNKNNEPKNNNMERTDDSINKVVSAYSCNGCIFRDGIWCNRPEHLSCYDDEANVDYIFTKKQQRNQK